MQVIATFLCPDCNRQFRIGHDFDHEFHCPECGRLLYLPKPVRFERMLGRLYQAITNESDRYAFQYVDSRSVLEWMLGLKQQNPTKWFVIGSVVGALVGALVFAVATWGGQMLEWFYVFTH